MRELLSKSNPIGVDVVTSGDLISLFVAVWDEEQYKDNIPVANALTDIASDAFNFIKNKILSDGITSELEVQKFIDNEIAKRNYLLNRPQL